MSLHSHPRHPRHARPAGPHHAAVTGPGALRPSATLHRSVPYGRSRGSRLAIGGVGGGTLLATVGGLGAILAAAASASPSPVTTSPPAPAVAPVHAAAAPTAPAAAALDGAAADRLAAHAAAVRAALVASRAASRSELRAALPAPAVAATGASVTGLASWYGPGFEGHLTASGVPYDEDALTAASRTLPLGTHLRVCRGGACVVVLINDWGPAPRSRILDLSRAAAERLGILGPGVAQVTATPVAA